MSAAPAFRLTDSTLRDGSHAVSHQFTTDQVRDVVTALDGAGVPVIEVTHGDGMGGSSFNYGFSHTPETDLLRVAVETATTSKIAVLFVPGIGVKDDLREAADIGVSIARIATHCTEADISEQHIALSKELGMEAVGFLMMSHMTTPEDLAEQARMSADFGADCVYVVDSAGALTMDGFKRRGRSRQVRRRHRGRGARAQQPVAGGGQLDGGARGRRRPDRRLHHRTRCRGRQLPDRGAGRDLREVRHLHRGQTRLR